MTDQTIPADKVEKIAASMREAMRRDDPYYSDGEFLMDMSHYIRDLEALLPALPLPTLADMTVEERLACQWMQADVEGYESRVVIVNPRWEDGIARVMWPGAHMRQELHRLITPRPDLPRLEWPGDKKPAPVLPDGWRLADHKGNGRVIVTNTTPNRDGYVYVVLSVDDPMGYDWHLCKPYELTYIDQETDQ